MKNIEDRLKEEYDKVEVPDYMFDTSRVFKKAEKNSNKSKNAIISFVASIVILIIAISLIVTIPKVSKENDINNNEPIINEIKGTIQMRNTMANIGYEIINNIASLKIEKIIEYTVINEIPYTKIKAKILNCYTGKNNESVELYVPGGVFTIKDIKNKLKYTQVDDISTYDDDDKVLINYYNYIKIAPVEEGKTYITTYYEIDGIYYINSNIKYGFKEYDPETNIVKDDMGDEQLDINRYLESINI